MAKHKNPKPKNVASSKKISNYIEKIKQLKEEQKREKAKERQKK